jgi:hypothetical protein
MNASTRTVETAREEMTDGSGPQDHLSGVQRAELCQQLNEPISRAVEVPVPAPEHPATSHPWGRSLRRRDYRTWSRHLRKELPVDEARVGEVPASRREDAPVPTTLCGYDPERVERMRAGFWGLGYAR